MEGICAEYLAEADELDGIVSGADLDAVTPAPGWNVGDQISHLWFFDRQAALALEDPSGFTAAAEVLMATGDIEQSVEPGRQMPGGELLNRWREDRRRLADLARSRDPRDRVPWYGPSMSLRSFITARLMETWAHGQDVVDGLGAERQPTDRLRHVAHIGVRARPFSYAVHGRETPEAEIRVELTGPSGDLWEWGPTEAVDRVVGPALDFCLVVTQRRHPDDVRLTVDGDAAGDWIAIAQAFAGPPGTGRRPGQFA